MTFRWQRENDLLMLNVWSPPSFLYNSLSFSFSSFAQPTSSGLSPNPCTQSCAIWNREIHVWFCKQRTGDWGREFQLFWLHVGSGESVLLLTVFRTNIFATVHVYWTGRKGIFRATFPCRRVNVTATTNNTQYYSINETEELWDGWLRTVSQEYSMIRSIC